MWQTQDHPGAPGTARQESTHIIVSTYDGGTATQPRAPGHERPHAASSGAARHGRLSAASTAPGADIPPTTTAGAPGQYCQSAVLRAPGHGRPLAITAGVSSHDRLSAASIATVPSPAGQPRLRQVILPRTPATPNTLTYPYPYHTVSSLRHNPQSTPRPAANPVGASLVGALDAPSPNVGEGPGVRPDPSPCPARGPQGGQFHSPPSPGACSGGGLGRGRLPDHPTTNQVHPAIQVLPRPRSCSTTATGVLRQHPSRAPPKPIRRKPNRVRPTPPLHWGMCIDRGEG